MEYTEHGVEGSEARRWGLGRSRLTRRDTWVVGIATLLLVPLLLAVSHLVPLPGFVERGIAALVPGGGDAKTAPRDTGGARGTSSTRPGSSSPTATSGTTAVDQPGRPGETQGGSGGTAAEGGGGTGGSGGR